MPVHLRLSGVSAASFEETVSFDSDSTGVSNLKLPAAPLHKAAQGREKLSIMIDYPAELAAAAEMQGYSLPSAGLSAAVSAMTKQCPHLSDEQEKWKKSGSFSVEWTYSQPTRSGNINLFKVDCFVFRKGVVFLRLSHNYGDLATKTRRSQGVDRKGVVPVSVTAGGATLHRAKDGSFSDYPHTTTLFGLEAPAAKIIRMLQGSQPILMSWGPEPALLNAFGASHIALPTNGLAEALAELQGKCPNLYK